MKLRKYSVRSVTYIVDLVSQITGTEYNKNLFDFFQIGKTADEIGKMSESDPDGLNAFLQTQHFKTFLFKLRSKVETYGDSQHNKISVQKVEQFMHKDYNDYLIKNIQRLTGIIGISQKPEDELPTQIDSE